MSDERWYEPGELAELSRPTMDRAVEAIEAGDRRRAIELCEEMKHEWRFLHGYKNPADVPERYWQRYGLERD
jgi:hypothetical protein